MKKYIHNPNIYRHHFQSGNALPGFHGRRMHRQQGDGIGAFLGKLARKAIPLLISGAKLAKPHVIKAAKHIAEDVGKSVVGKIIGTKSNKRKKGGVNRVRRRKYTKRSTSSDIFDQ